MKLIIMSMGTENFDNIKNKIIDKFIQDFKIIRLSKNSVPIDRVKTDEEGQYICSEIQKLATKIDKLNKNIKLCNFIEERTLRMKDNVKEMSQEIKFKIKNRDRDYR